LPADSAYGFSMGNGLIAWARSPTSSLCNTWTLWKSLIR
jgi:hypothetical protein